MSKMFNIILYTPQIPPNTGNIIRLCANTGSKLHLIKPYGFKLNNKSFKRAGLDYHELTDFKEYYSFDDFIEKIRTKKKIYAVSKFGQTQYNKVKFEENDFLLFGSETFGLPKEVLNKINNKNKIFIPMKKGNRSINLSNAVSIVIYEAWKQIDFK